MGLFDKIKQGATKAADMAQQTVEVTRLNNQISSKRKEIERLTLQMGHIVLVAYQNHNLSGAEGQIESISESIMSLQRDIAAVEAKIREVKDEKCCPGCSNTVPYSSKFCNSCGHQFNDLEPSIDMMPVITAEPVLQLKHCTNCGAEMESDSRFCTECGSPQQQEGAV